MTTRRSPLLPLRLFALLAASAAASCGGASTAPPTATPRGADASPPTPPKPLPPIPVAAPEVAQTPSSCAVFSATPMLTGDMIPKDVCVDAKHALATLAAAARSEVGGNRVGRDVSLAALSSCERVPLLVPDVIRAELAPAECAEALVSPALEAHGRGALPDHQAAARAMVAASRLARLRPKPGAFDLLARAEVDPAAGEAGTKSVVAWKAAIEKEEGGAIALAKGAPSEIGAIVRFEIAAAWLALAKELRGTPLPEELAPLIQKDPELKIRYLAKLDEVTMPIVDRARRSALAGLGIAVRDGVLVKELASFKGILESYRSEPGFEVRATRALDLLTPSTGEERLAAAKGDEATIGAVLPPWAAQTALERLSAKDLSSPAVLESLAANRGVPSSLRLELERDKKLDDTRRSAVVLARLRTALAYGSRPDAEAAAAWVKPRSPADHLRVAVARALLGPATPPPKLGDPSATKVSSSYDLTGLDALAKQGGRVGGAAAYDAALLALESAQTFGGDAADPAASAAEQKKAYQAAIERLDAIVAMKGVEPTRQAEAKKLADGARESIRLLGEPGRGAKRP